MAENQAQELSGEGIREAAKESVSTGVDIRDKVHDLTLAALKHRRFDRRGMREVVQAVTEGVALGAEKSRADMRQALADGFRGLDEALTKAAQAGREALSHLVAMGKDLSDHEVKQALANLRKLEDDFLSTASQVADSASEKVRPELRELVHTARQTGTETGRKVALTMTEVAQRFSVASIDIALAGLEAATEFGTRFAKLASGVLSGLADALSQRRPEETKPEDKRPQ